MSTMASTIMPMSAPVASPPAAAARAVAQSWKTKSDALSVLILFKTPHNFSSSGIQVRTLTGKLAHA